MATYEVTRAMSAGAHTIKVEYYEGGGGAKLQGSWTRTGAVLPPPDTQAPTMPSNVTAVPLSATEVKLAWNAATDNLAVTGYKLYRDNVRIQTVTGLSFTDATLSAATTYQYAISAIDAAGNESARSAIVSVTTPAVINPPPPPPPVNNPAVTIIAPGGAASGVQAFSSYVAGLTLTDYNMFWQVDGDRINAMHDSTDGIPHKEALVDVSGWNWKGVGLYIINFIAKNIAGDVIAQKSVSITIQ